MQSPVANNGATASSIQVAGRGAVVAIGLYGRAGAPGARGGTAVAAAPPP